MEPQNPSVTSEEIEAYLQGKITSLETLRRIEAHLEQSDEARANLLKWSGGQQKTAFLQQIADSAALEDQPIPDELVLSYVMGTATPLEREIAETLAADSARDQKAIDSLASFHQQMQTYDWQALKQTAESKGRKPAAQAQGYWERRNRAGLFGRSSIMAGAFCCLLTVTLLNTWLLLRPVSHSDAQAKGGIILPMADTPKTPASDKDELYASRSAAEDKQRSAYLLAALQLAREQMGQNSRDAAECYRSLGRFYMESGRQAEARQNLQKAADIFSAQKFGG